jgi:hypothetical protein
MNAAADLPRVPGAEASTVAGLARELEALHRQVRQLRADAGRVDELGATVAQLAETLAGHGQPAGEPAPSWLDHPAEPGRDPASSRAALDATKLLATLAGWVAGAYLRYSDAGSGLPDCWLRHPDVVEELLWLHRAWLAAYAPHAPATAVGDWHDRQRPGVVARIRAYAGTCSLDAHRPGGDQHTSPPTKTPADAAQVIATWWATARDQPAPAPTPEQLAAAHDRHRRTRR